jgi:hypothetical protein
MAGRWPLVLLGQEPVLLPLPLLPVLPPVLPLVLLPVLLPVLPLPGWLQPIYPYYRR